MSANNTYFGQVAIIGRANAGKSTLINGLAEEYISIVSRKINTTRFPIKAIVTDDLYQMVLVDTAGLFKPPKASMDKAIQRASRAAFMESDIIVLIMDSLIASRDISQSLPSAAILKLIKDQKKPVLAILNKIDKIEKGQLLKIAADLENHIDYKNLFMISALKKEGVAEVKQAIQKILPTGVWHYDPEDLTDLPLRNFCEELTRQSLLEKLHQEIPYNIGIETEEFKETDKSVTIRQVLFLSSKAHKPIILGRGGQKLKDIGQNARYLIQNVLSKKIHLYLTLKIDEKWQDRFIQTVPALQD